MPFTPADAPKYDKAANTAAKKRMWASIANAVLKKHGDDGMAIRVASSKVESLLQRAPLLIEDGHRRPGALTIKPSKKGKPLFKERVKKFLKKTKEAARQWSGDVSYALRKGFDDPRLGK